jgi:hypothetical protein
MRQALESGALKRTVGTRVLCRRVGIRGLQQRNRECGTGRKMRMRARNVCTQLVCHVGLARYADELAGGADCRSKDTLCPYLSKRTLMMPAYVEGRPTPCCSRARTRRASDSLAGGRVWCVCALASTIVTASPSCSALSAVYSSSAWTSPC